MAARLTTSFCSSSWLSGLQLAGFSAPAAPGSHDASISLVRSAWTNYFADQQGVVTRHYLIVTFLPLIFRQICFCCDKNHNMYLHAEILGDINFKFNHLDGRRPWKNPLQEHFTETCNILKRCSFFRFHKSSGGVRTSLLWSNRFMILVVFCW